LSVLALALVAASGFAALGYQIVWTQQSTVWLGHEAAAVLAVVAAFFGGLALGAFAFAARIERSARPARWYAAAEALIGAWSAALALLIGPAASLLLTVTGAEPSPAWQWSVAFCGTFLLLLPATAAMGATLPAMERLIVQLGARGSPIAALYAANTFGAVLGVLAAAFWLVPQFGLARTGVVCAALNFACAAAALGVFRESAPATPPRPSAAPPRALWVLAVTGLLGIGYEVLVVRVLAQVAENTVYTFALLLAVYLVGTALGAAVHQRRPAPADRLLWLLALACLLGTASLWGAAALKQLALRALGASMGAALAAEAAMALAAFLLPTVLMGALFSALATEARAGGLSFGRALGINTLGAAAAPLLFGVLLVPLAGLKLALLAAVAGYLALASWRSPPVWAVAAAAVIVAVAAPRLAFIDVPPGGHVVSYAEGAMAAVSVVEDAAGVARLHIDNREQEGSSATRYSDGRQALLPLLLHPAPRRALFLGLGTGITAATAAGEPRLEVDAVELVPEVIAASGYFTRDFADRSRLRVMPGDARRFVRASGARYDVIVADNVHPARSGSGALYTVEHFRAVRERLADDGVFCQWLPLHQLDLQTLASIVRAFLAVYPDAKALLATHSLDTPVLGLIARRDAGRLRLDQVRARLAETNLAQFGIDDELSLLGAFVAGPAALARFAAGAPLNTDDHPVVAYAAPRIAYAPDSRARDRLLALVGDLGIAPEELIAGPAEAGWSARLAAYWRARDLYLAAGRDVQPSADVRRMLAQVKEPLLAVLRVSPDFRPAYDPLVRMASALAGSDAGAARLLLAELELTQPARPEATQAQERPHCEAPDAPGDTRDITCALPGSGVPQRFLFSADFSGSHDDTTLSLEATLDGAPLACAPGSKTDSSFEDGQVRLACRFTVSAGPGRTLAVALRWRHAQYMGFGVAAD